MQSEGPEFDSPIDDMARECLYRFLSAVVAGPDSPGWYRATDAGDQELALEAARWLQAESDGCDVSRLIEELQAPLDTLRAQYEKVFGIVVPKDCPPYETEYYPSQETFGRSQHLADVAGFYRAFGIGLAQSVRERPDHLALELEFMAFLLLKKRMTYAAGDHDPAAGEQASICEQAHRDFFRDHLAWWVPAFAGNLRRKLHDGYLHALAEVLAAWVPAECRRLEIRAALRPARPDVIEEPVEQSGCAACLLRP
jgi:DMSO reductase family type II enzyme chaperone